MHTHAPIFRSSRREIISTGGSKCELGVRIRTETIHIRKRERVRYSLSLSGDLRISLFLFRVVPQPLHIIASRLAQAPGFSSCPFLFFLFCLPPVFRSRAFSSAAGRGGGCDSGAVSKLN